MTVATVDTLGRRLIQNAGFLMMTLFLAILAGAYNNLLEHIGVCVQHTCSFMLHVTLTITLFLSTLVTTIHSIV
jgi:hypothetical protein